jgi:hypothetical protein
MFIHRNLIKAILVYIVFFIVASVVFSAFYYIVASRHGDTSPFYDWLFFSMMTFASIDYSKVQAYPETWTIISVQYLVNSIFVPIISGVIFYFILNRPPRIIFPKKLIMRTRTSEGSQGKLTLSVKIANSDRYRAYNVSCQLVYSYFKPEDNTYNRETNFTRQISYIDRTYRFSFELDGFPSAFLKTYLFKKGVNYRNDRILVIVSGKFGRLGDIFLVEKEYRFEDIDLAKDTEKLYGYKVSEDGMLETTKINYSNLDRVIPYSEDERAEINEYIKTLLQEKERAEELRLQSLRSAEPSEKSKQTVFNGLGVSSIGGRYRKVGERERGQGANEKVPGQLNGKGAEEQE